MQIPADMVINSMIVALEACSKSCSKTLIYHIGSSLRNPFITSDVEDLAHQYFTKHPLTDMFGKPVACSKKVSWMSSVSSFHRYINIRYMLPLKVCISMEIKAHIVLPYIFWCFFRLSQFFVSYFGALL